MMRDESADRIAERKRVNELHEGWKVQRHFWWLLPVTLALLLRVAGAIAIDWRYPTFLFGDSNSYWDLGRDLSRGGPYEYGWEGARCFRTPGYPAILAPLFWLWQEPPLLAARLWGAILGTVVVGLIIRLGWRLGSPRIGSLAGWLAALHPELIISSALVLSETTFEVLLALQCLCWVSRDRVSETPQKRKLHFLLPLGLFAGLAVLVRPSWAAALPIWFLALCLESRDASGSVISLKLRCRRALVFGFVAALVMSPWWIRNALLYETWIPTSLQVGASLYDGLHEGATGGSDLSGVDSARLDFVRAQTLARLSDAEASAWIQKLPSTADRELYWQGIREQVPPLWKRLQEVDPTLPAFEVAFDRELRRQAWEWARQHPRRVWELAGLKALRLWSPWPQEGAARSGALRWVFGLAFFGSMSLAFAGVRGAGRWRDGWILVAPAIGFTAIHLLHVASIRYREPAWVGLLIVAAVGAASITSRLGWGKEAGID